MHSKEIEETRKKIIDKLKKGIKKDILEDFVENHKRWKQKMESINSVISHVDESISHYTYDEFCKKIVEITEKCLNEGVNYEKIFISEHEYARIKTQHPDNQKAMEEKILKELHEKFFNNFMMVLNAEHLKESVKHKIGEKFSLVEEELDKSLELAKSIYKKGK